MEIKKWFKSKTVGLGSGLAVLGLAILALPEFRQVIDQIPPEYQGAASLLLGVVVVVLRHYTTQPLSTNQKAVDAHGEESE